jgi:uncharacterized membrane protein YwzB
MSAKLALYILILPFTLWCVEALKIEQFFKKNRSRQILIFYVLVVLGMTYLVVNFIYDFYEVSRIL